MANELALAHSRPTALPVPTESLRGIPWQIRVVVTLLNLVLVLSVASTFRVYFPIRDVGPD